MCTDVASGRAKGVGAARFSPHGHTGHTPATLRGASPTPGVGPWANYRPSARSIARSAAG